MSGSIQSVTIDSVATDTGPSAVDFYTRDQTLNFSGLITLSGDGSQTPTLGFWAVNGSISYYLGAASYTTSGIGAQTVAWTFGASSQALPEGDWTIEAIASNSTSDTAPTGTIVATHALTIDTTAPTETSQSNAFGHIVQVDGTDANPAGAGSYVFGSAYGDAITVGDNNADILKVTIKVGAGSTFAATSASGGSIGGQIITITGTADVINAALENSTYTSGSTDTTPGNIDDTITITTTDQAGNSVVKTISIDVICFMAGTMIRTPDGEAPVETLKRGDLVVTAEGLAKPVAWLGRQTVSRLFANPLRVLPIRIKAGALAENVPARDLLISPDHALLIDGILVQAGALVNGSSIVRETRTPAVFQYYHVELDDHSLIMAENTPAETFIDNVGRMNFDNWAEHEALYPQGKPLAEMPYPRAKSHRQAPIRLRARLAERAAAIGATAEQLAAA